MGSKLTSQKKENVSMNDEEASIAKLENRQKEEELSVLTSLDSAQSIMKENNMLALEQPTWAYIADKPKLASVDQDPVLSPLKDAIPLKSAKASTIVVSVDEDVKQEQLKTEDSDGFIKVQSK